ncbi:MAG TPA: DUF1622 domain-containing protein [Roseiarcus sp.]|nr:DUF1622 domain-containing protein [Roseiarcus sp.]
MKKWLIVATDYAVTVIDWGALIVIAVGAVEAFFQGLRRLFAGQRRPHEARGLAAPWPLAGRRPHLPARRRHSRTAVTTSWDEVARLAAIAAIRTFLNFFLERDIDNVRDRRAEPVAEREGNA